MPPPPAEPFAARVFLGPALRAQSDRRLVTLVREGYETAFEEIVRRYRKPLDRFAAVFVGDRSEDVTQDAFSKALLALRGSEKEIELRPWLYRIVRNTALNDLRDRPAAAEQLGEAIAGGASAAIEAERREEMAELMQRLRALPEPQRAAIVMRELEGLSHEEIAAALGVSGGAARQAIYRARATLRDGFGLLLPLPLLRFLFDNGAEAAGAGAGAAGAGAASAAGGGGAAMGGLGAAGALKVGVATVVLAGSVGAGVAIQKDRGGEGRPVLPVAEAAEFPGGENAAPAGLPSSGLSNSGPDRGDTRGASEDRGHGSGGDGDSKRGRGGRADDGGGRGRGDEGDDSGSNGDTSHSGHGSGPRIEHGGSGSGRGGSGGSDDDRSGGEGVSGGEHSGRHGSGGGTSESGSGSDSNSGSSGHGGGSGSGSSGGGADGSDGGHGSGDSGKSGDDSGSSGGPAAVLSPPPAPEPPPDESGGEPDDGGGSGSGSGSGGSGSGSDDS